MSCDIEPCPGTTLGVIGQLFLLLIKSLVQRQCDLDSTNDYQQNYGPHLCNSDCFDFIVVGAGAAGSVIANRLTEVKGFSVLLIEAGGLPSVTSKTPLTFMGTMRTEEDWQYSPQPTGKSCLGMVNQRCCWAHGRALGGNTAINTNQYLRTNSYDIKRWKSYGITAFNDNNVQRLYKKSEDCKKASLLIGINPKHATGGPRVTSHYTSNQPMRNVILQGNSELGVPFSDDQPEAKGCFESLVTIEKGIRASASHAFLSKIKNQRPQLYVAYGATVEKIVFEGRQAVGVTVKYGSKTKTVRANKEVIITAGAIESPKLLMLSGVGDKAHLQSKGVKVVADVPGVGGSMQDHVGFFGFAVQFDEACSVNAGPFATLDALYQYLMHRSGVFATMDLLNVVCYGNNHNQTDHPDLHYYNMAFSKKDELILPTMLNMLNLKPSIRSAVLAKNADCPLLFMIPTLVTPMSRGHVKLASSNPNVKPVINANTFTHEEDVFQLLKGIRFLQRLIKTKPFKKCNARQYVIPLPHCAHCGYDTDDYWCCAIRHLSSTTWQPVGTTRMGPAKHPHTVVDEHYRVTKDKIRNLRVVGAGNVPEASTGNNNALVVMIAEHACEVIKKDYGK